MNVIRNMRGAWLLLGALATLVIISVGCAPAAPTPAPTPTVVFRLPTYGEITPGPHVPLADLSTVIQVPPFPYSMPLPPAVPTVLDGLYTRAIPLEGTPTPCKRCAGYRIEGGIWSLYLDRGVFKVFQRESEFEAVGSYAISGDRITFFNDPYCEEDLRMVGTYTWSSVSDTLTLKAVGDACSIGLRAKNLTATPWVKTPVDAQARAQACQPPNREAAVTDHWKKPVWCQ